MIEHSQIALTNADIKRRSRQVRKTYYLLFFVIVGVLFVLFAGMFGFYYFFG